MSSKELDQLYLSKNERLGILILFSFLLIIILVPWLYTTSGKKDVEEPRVTHELSNKVIAPVETIEINQTSLVKQETKNTLHKSKNMQYELFVFNPNKLSPSDASRLGLNVKVYNNLKKYLATGAIIRNAEQLKFIYGMDSITFNRLKPYVQLEENVSKKPKIKSEKHILKIDLNDAKAVDLLPLPSIGERLVERIIKYRNALGGFINTAQLTEVYGITDSIYQIIRPYVYIEKEHSKIDINNTELEQLKSHPYIGYKKAKLLCIYKEQHQVIRNTEELYTIKALDSNWIHRLEPYIKYR